MTTPGTRDGIPARRTDGLETEPVDSDRRDGGVRTGACGPSRTVVVKLSTWPTAVSTWQATVDGVLAIAAAPGDAR